MKKRKLVLFITCKNEVICRPIIYFDDIFVFFFTYMQQFIYIHSDFHLSSLQSFFDRRLSEMEYRNTTRVDLPEVDFSFHEDNHKVKEMTVQGFPCPRSFPLIFFTNFLLINLGGWQLSIKGASWSREVTLVISLTLWLSSWKEKSTPSWYFCNL